MNRLESMISYNEKFVRRKEYLPYQTSKYPDEKILVVTCMDTRLLELLPKACDLRNGDAKVVKTAGALISNPFGSVMRSILVGVSLLKAEEVFVIGHLDCGMIGLESDHVLEELETMGVPANRVGAIEEQGIDVKKWLCGCVTVEEGVRSSVANIRNHPLFPKRIPVHGLIIDPSTGKLEIVINGYN